MDNRKKIIGIDLGTTNSCVAVIEGGKPVVIANTEGSRTTPSVVFFDQNGGRLVGLPAKRQAVKHPDRTIQSIKRYMGSNYRVTIDSMEFSPEQVSACILQKLKIQAQQYLNEKVTQAIITVPAYFDDSQRLATRHAGEIAGLEVLRVINEPTASALAYGFNKPGEESNIVVFDFGGGTFDVTILQLSQGVLQVKSTNGNNRLGGDDFDERIAKLMVHYVRKLQGVDLRGDPVAKQRLKEAAEKAKIELSDMGSTHISLPFLGFKEGDPLHLDMDITQSQFNQLSEDLVRATGLPIQAALQDAKLSASQIDHVLLVGGSTRMPSVQQFIRGYFNKEPVKSINPDEAVSIGAAIQGGILSGEIQDVLLLDVIPITIGIEEPGGNFRPVVQKNSTIPVTKTLTCITTRDSQTSFPVHVLQGENNTADKNVSLARFDVDGIPAAPAGQQKMDIVFDIDADGIFNCSVKHAGGQMQKVVLKRTTGYNPEQLEVLKRNEAVRAQREQEEANCLASGVLAESSIADAERLLAKFAGQQSEQAGKVRSAIDALKSALQGASIRELETLRQNLEQSVAQCMRSSAGR